MNIVVRGSRFPPVAGIATRSRSQVDLESRILASAVKSGLVSASELDGLPSSSHGLCEEEHPWGSRLEALVRRGVLTEAQVRSLTLEAIQSGTSGQNTDQAICPDSWVQGGTLDQTPESAWRLPSSTRYEELELLASGGTARVYRAFDTVLQRSVALKFLKDAVGGGKAALLREARAQAQVDHPNICKVFEVSEGPGEPFIAMQLVCGRTLSHVGPSLSLDAKVEVVRDIAEAMHAAHRKGLIHLDLKPGNILMERGEAGVAHPLVADFGLYLSEGANAAELLAQRWLPYGTPPYSSPEQLAGSWDQLDRRSDIYSLGAVLYWLLSGSPPFEGSDPAILRKQILETIPKPLRKVRPGVPADLEAIVQTCMARNPQDRYASALALSEDLQRYLDGEPVSIKPQTLRYRFRTWVRRNRKLSWSLAGSCFLLLGAGGWVVRTHYRGLERAQLAASYEKILTDLNGVMRDMTHPLHDTRVQRDLGLQSLNETRKHLQTDGPLAEAPIQLALGRASYSMGFPEPAQQSLEAAWKGGFDGPDTSIFLAMVLTERYLSGVDACSLLPRVEWEQRMKQLDVRFRQPALEQTHRYLKTEPQSVVARMHLAILENRLEDAQAMMEGWAKKDPELKGYWAVVSAGQVLRISRAAAEDHPDQVRKALRNRREMTQQVLELLPSNSAVYLDLATCDYLEAHLLATKDKEKESLLRRSLEQCARALVCEPDNPSLLLQAAKGRLALAETLKAQQLPVSADITESSRQAQEALRLLPKWEPYLGGESTADMQKEAQSVLKSCSELATGPINN